MGKGLGFRGLGFRGLRFRGLGFRGLGFRGFGFRGSGVQGFRGLGFRGLGFRSVWFRFVRDSLGFAIGSRSTTLENNKRRTSKRHGKLGYVGGLFWVYLCPEP